MKSRLKKKLVKKALGLKTQPTPLQASPPDSIRGIANGCWRIRQLLPDFAGNRKQPVLMSILEQILDSLEAAGVEIEDPKGTAFLEGTTLEVALFEESAELPVGNRRIVETLSPAVYIGGKLVQPARVIVEVGTGR